MLKVVGVATEKECRAAYDGMSDEECKLQMLASAFLLECEAHGNVERFHEAVAFIGVVVSRKRPAFEAWQTAADTMSKVYARHAAYCSADDFFSPKDAADAT